MVLTPVVRADDCNQVIKDCNVALNKADAVIASQNELIIKYTNAYDACNASNVGLRMDLEKAVESRDAWYRNPIVTVLGGIALGLVAGAYLMK